jgi:low affinity Fe/Cu permease
MQSNPPQPPPVTRLLTQIARIAGSRWTATGVTVAVVLYLIIGAVTGFGHGWQLAVHTTAALVTLPMLFICSTLHDRLHHAGDDGDSET